MEYELIYSLCNGVVLKIYDDNNSNIYYNIPNDVINLIVELSKKNSDLKDKIKELSKNE